MPDSGRKRRPSHETQAIQEGREVNSSSTRCRISALLCRREPQDLEKVGETVSEPTHPPIPTNCGLFLQMDIGPDKGRWFMRHEWSTVALDSAEGTARTIIAAVARCAWLDEKERRYIESKLVTYPEGSRFLEEVFDAKGAEWERLHAEMDRLCDWVDEAGNNAHAWKAWGRGEPWK